MKHLALIATLLALALPAAAQTTPQTAAKPAATKPAPAATLPARMDGLAKFYADNGQFMGTVLVAQGDRVLLNKGYGYANLEWKIPNTPDTKFRLGSITKQFTAAAILLLEERGKLSVSDPVKTYMPDAPAAWDKITIRHLLSHTAGVPNYTAIASFMKNRSLPITPVELIALVKDKPLEFEPGQGWNYSNSGYIVLGYLIEKISGQTYEKFLADNIFTPLRMKDSGYDSHLAVMERRASGYSPGPKNADYIDMTTPFSAGALYSTTGDLLRWERALFAGKLLKPETLARMTAPVRENYGFGVSIITQNGRKRVEHGGGIDGFNTYMAHYPAEKTTVIVLGNLVGPGVNAVSGKLTALAVGDTVELPSERKRVAVNAATLARYAGFYQMGPMVAEVTVEKGRTFLKTGTDPRKEIFPISQNRFFAVVPDTEWEFTGPAGAPAAELVRYQDGNPSPARRTTEAEVAKAAEAMAARRKGGVPDPRSEAALRKTITGIVAGTPDYDSMAPGFANATRTQMTGLRARLGGMGAVKAVTFTEVGPNGADVYKVEFEKGSATWRVLMQEDGKIASMGFQPG